MRSVIARAPAAGEHLHLCYVVWCSRCASEREMPRRVFYLCPQGPLREGLMWRRSAWRVIMLILIHGFSYLDRSNCGENTPLLNAYARSTRPHFLMFRKNCLR
jgi:hypothetical protein